MDTRQQPLECRQRQSRPGRCPAGDSGLNDERVRSYTRRDRTAWPSEICWNQYEGRGVGKREHLPFKGAGSVCGCQRDGDTVSQRTDTRAWVLDTTILFFPH